jgi:hypothetical protein
VVFGFEVEGRGVVGVEERDVVCDRDVECDSDGEFSL